LVTAGVKEGGSDRGEGGDIPAHGR
jgi:hypothetical protein